MLLWKKFILFFCYLMTCFTITTTVKESSFKRIDIVYKTDFKNVDLRNFTEVLRFLIPVDGLIGSNIFDADASKVGNRSGLTKYLKEDYFSHQRPPSKIFQNEVLKKVIRNTTIPCENDQTLCDGYNTELVCVDGLCQCSGNSCWIYTIKYYGYFKYDITFTCGTCGQLGSECETNVCNPPGICLSDNYCHCDIGEHYDSDPDICTVYHGPTSASLFLAGLLFFLFIGLFALTYSFFSNYRSTGYIIWCRDPRWSRRRRIQSRRNATFGPPKSPAFTMDIISRNEELPISILSDNSSASLRESNNELINQDIELTNSPKEGHTFIDLEYTESEDHTKSLVPPSVKKKRPQLLKLTVSSLEIDSYEQVYEKNHVTVSHTKKLEENSKRTYNKSEESDKEIIVSGPIEDSSGMTMYYEEYESRL